MRARSFLISSLAGVLVLGCATAYHDSRPPAPNGLGSRPKSVEVPGKLPEPRLDPADPGRTTVELIAWASASTLGEREAVRKAIQQVSANDAVVRSLCSEAFAGRSKDHSRTLIVLGLIGETKSETGEKCLTEFVRLPFPQSGHEVEGEILEQAALGSLQAKAADGLAYRMTATGDAEVLRLIREHPSRIVRAEAISAYLWNRNDSAEAKAALASVVRPEEKVFLDRVRRVPGERAETFNPKLKAFLDAHPELLPPVPVKGEDRGKGSLPPNCVVPPADQKAPSSARPKGE